MSDKLDLELLVEAFTVANDVGGKHESGLVKDMVMALVTRGVSANPAIQAYLDAHRVVHTPYENDGLISALLELKG